VRYRALVGLPIALVACVLAAWGAAPDARASLLVTAVALAKALALGGCVAAALAFEPGDYLRRAWTLLAASTVMLFARDAVAFALPHAGGALWLQGLLATAGNASSVGGTSMLARAWRVSGLEERGERAGSGMRVAAAVVALLVTGAPIASDVRALAGGDAFAAVPLASDLADAFVLTLLAPLLQTTLALRGGVLRWPWALLTLGNLLWLVFDATYGVLALLHLTDAGGHMVTEGLRVLATTYTFSAGLAQRWAVAGEEAA